MILPKLVARWAVATLIGVAFMALGNTVVAGDWAVVLIFLGGVFVGFAQSMWFRIVDLLESRKRGNNKHARNVDILRDRHYDFIPSSYPDGVNDDPGVW